MARLAGEKTPEVQRRCTQASRGNAGWTNNSSRAKHGQPFGGRTLRAQRSEQSRGWGYDAVPPRALFELPDQGIEALIDLIMLIDQKNASGPTCAIASSSWQRQREGCDPSGSSLPSYACASRLRCGRPPTRRVSSGPRTRVERCVWEQAVWSEWATADRHAVASTICIRRCALYSLLYLTQHKSAPPRWRHACRSSCVLPRCTAHGFQYEQACLRSVVVDGQWTQLRRYRAPDRSRRYVRSVAAKTVSLTHRHIRCSEVPDVEPSNKLGPFFSAPVGQVVEA